MKSWLAAALVVLATAGPAWSGTMGVFVSILPQKYFVEKIGGSLVKASVLVAPGASPHSYEPKPGQMVELSRARLYFAIGVNFEEVWLDKIQAANPGLKVVHTEKGVEKIAMMEHHHEDGEMEAEEGSEEEHEGLDPHIWTSPLEVKIIARNMMEALVEADPENAAAYAGNFQAFSRELDDVDRELREALAGREGMRFMVFHPAWGYLARDYGLRQVPVELEGKEPKPAQLKELIERARKDGIKVIFVQPQFSSKSAEVIAKAIGGRVVFADPLAYEWTDNLRMQAARFKEALR
ncbi:MAG: zinc ABC transporter substrate-binding protein [Pseudomonadota bacterium]